ncbi:MAG TPA: peptide ABC transporter substrate-binding protein [Actinobacteria bacterium]|nr:peptide ABC transporter substrate-binding protein [Actinomycetota bacterium]
MTASHVDENAPPPAGAPLADEPSLLTVDGLVAEYRSARGIIDTIARRAPQVVHAVDDVSFTLRRGEMLALVGESGCGKTTTAQTVLRLIEPVAGSIEFAGQDITKLSHSQLRPMRQRMQLVYQDPYESLNPRYRVSQVVEEPLRIHGIGNRLTRAAMVNEALARVELQPTDQYADRFPHELSGGQRQRVAIAASLVVKPELFVADEPVSMLDVSVRAGIMSLLRKLCSEDGMGVLIIAHDLAVVAHYAQRIAVMYLGRIVELGPTRQVLSNPQHPYTRALCAVAPRREPATEPGQVKLLGGEPADATAIPSGCRFHPRCPIADEGCPVTDPRLHIVPDSAGNHEVACLRVP